MDIPFINIRGTCIFYEDSTSMKPHILLIDNSEKVQTAVSSVLADRDYILTTASTGEEGLSCIKHQHYSLVLVDYTLPDTDGLSLLHAILKEDPDVPVIMVSARGDKLDQDYAREMGADGYITKPFMSQELLAMVGQLVMHTSEA